MQMNVSESKIMYNFHIEDRQFALYSCIYGSLVTALWIRFNFVEVAELFLLVICNVPIDRAYLQESYGFKFVFAFVWHTFSSQFNSKATLVRYRRYKPLLEAQNSHTNHSMGHDILVLNKGKSVQQTVNEALQRVPNDSGEKYIDEVQLLVKSALFYLKIQDPNYFI